MRPTYIHARNDGHAFKWSSPVTAQPRNNRLQYLAYCILLIIAILVGGYARFSNLQKTPPALFADELDGYVGAASLFENGHDINGRTQLFFYGDLEYHPPVNGLLQYLSVLLFGKSPFALRFPAAFLGTLSIPLLARLAFLLYRSEMTACATAIAFATIPWTVHYGRIGWNEAEIPFMMIVAVLLWCEGASRRAYPLAIAGTLVLSLLPYTYQPGFVYGSAFLVFFIATSARWMSRRQVAALILVALVVVGPAIAFYLTTPNALERAANISAFRDGITPQSILLFAQNYTAHFSVSFLFINGDANPRMSPRAGLLYSWMVLGGLFFTTRTPDAPRSAVRPLWLILFWLAIFPLGGSLTNDGVPHAGRTIFASPAFCLAFGSAFGGIYRRSRAISADLAAGLLVGAVLAIVVSVGGFLRAYLQTYDSYSREAWEPHESRIMAALASEHGPFYCVDGVEFFHQRAMAIYYLGLESDSPRLTWSSDSRSCKRKRSVIVRDSSLGRLPYKLVTTVDPGDGDKYFIYNNAL